jgi:Bacterial Ig-like domain
VAIAARSAMRARAAFLALSILLLAGLLPAAALAVAPASPPTLTAPADGITVSANPVLAWNTLTGASKYRVQVSTSNTFATTVYSVDTVNTKATPPADLPLGSLYWRVAGMDSSSNLGPYATRSFTKDWGAAPTLTAPADGATLDFPSQPVLFTWQPLAGAKTYTLELDDAPDFIGATSVSTVNTAYSLTEPQTVGQSFYWRVRGTSATSGVVSDWSETRSYDFSWSSVPQLTYPDNGATVTEVVLEWDPVPGAKTYQLQVSPNGDWTNNVTFDVSIKSTRYSPTSTLLNGTYFWRVRAKDAKSTPNNGGWSEERTLTRGWPEKPTLLTPAWATGDPATTVPIPTFSWTPVPLASHYEIEFSHDPNFSPGDSSTESCFTNHTTFTQYTKYTASGEPGSCSSGTASDVGEVVYWHVRAIDAPKGVLGLWSNTSTSDTFRFIRDPGRVTLTDPGDGDDVTVPTLEWDAVDSIERYRVTILKSNGTTATGGTPVLTYATSFTPASLTATDEPFYWYVQTVDGNGVTSPVPASNDWFSFTLSDPTPTGSLTIVTPTGGASSVRMPAMSWTPYTGATYYKVRYGSDGFESPTPLSGSSELAFTAFTYAGLTLAPNTYFWYVEAYDATDAVIATSGQSTFEIVAADTLGVGDYTAPDKCAVLEICVAERDTPTLEWAPSPGAGWYEITIANDVAFSNVVRIYGSAYDRMTPRESLVDNQAGQAFFWFVRPCVDATRSRCGPGATNDLANDNASAFQKKSKPIALLTPANAATVNSQVTFTWEDFLDTNGELPNAVTQEAKQYRIQVSLVSDFASIYDTATVDQTTYTSSGKTYPVGPLYWRVQAIDGSGNFLTTSASRTLTFTAPAPAQTSPANGAGVTGVPAMKWNAIDYAATYTVEVYKNGDTNYSPTNKVLTQTTKFTAWTPTTALAGGTYAWRVRGNDADGRALPWSSGRTFVLSKAAPALTNPANGAGFQTNSLFFTWTAVSGAVQYRFESSTSSSFSSIYSSQNTIMTAWAPTSAIADGTYYWRVKVLDASGNTLATSSSRSFSKDTTKPTVTAKSPTSNAAINGSFTATFSEPVKGISATTFKMVVAGTATAIGGTVTPSSSSTLSTTAAFKPTVALVPGQSYTLTLTSGITDNAGNALATTTWTVRTSVTIDQTSPAMLEVWDRDTNASASGGSYGAARLSGAKTTFTFTGTNVTLLARKASDGGKADVYVDGAKVTTIDFYNAATQWKNAIWTKAGLANAKHTVTVVVAGTKQAASSSTWVYVDAFKVGTTVYEESNAAVKDQHRRSTNASAYGGSYDVTNHAASGDTGDKPLFKVVFKGTDLLVYATKTSGSGKADIYIDGALKATVDLYAAATTYKVKVFDSAALVNGVHTLVIKANGAKAAASSSTSVSIDQVVTK